MVFVEELGALELLQTLGGLHIAGYWGPICCPFDVEVRLNPIGGWRSVYILIYLQTRVEHVYVRVRGRVKHHRSLLAVLSPLRGLPAAFRIDLSLLKFFCHF